MCFLEENHSTSKICCLCSVQEVLEQRTFLLLFRISLCETHHKPSGQPRLRSCNKHLVDVWLIPALSSLEISACHPTYFHWPGLRRTKNSRPSSSLQLSSCALLSFDCTLEAEQEARLCKSAHLWAASSIGNICTLPLPFASWSLGVFEIQTWADLAHALVKTGIYGWTSIWQKPPLDGPRASSN